MPPALNTNLITPAIVVHGGAGNCKSYEDGCRNAASLGMERLHAHDDPIAAVVAAVVALENDPRYNAGIGAILRSDGRTIETDAAVMDSLGRLGAVACLQHIRNPVLVALQVSSSPHWLLSGEGALEFALRYEHPTCNLEPGEAAYKCTSACDTVGAVARNSLGEFGVACSTGGCGPALRGRVGDTPILGCGYWAGPHGAVTVTGKGETIVPKLLSKFVYDLFANGAPLDDALQSGMYFFSDLEETGIIAITRKEASFATNSSMPCHIEHHVKL